MPAIHVRDVPETVIAALKERAARHGWSMQRELRAVLQKASEEPAEPVSLPPLDLIEAHGTGNSSWSRDEIYDDNGR